MELAGLTKLTLLDFPGKVACTVFTAGCNFRCPFCHNSSLVLPDRWPNFPEEEVLQFLKKRAGILDGVAVSGGEPLLHPDLGDFLKKVRDLGYLVKLDTNGSFPERLQTLVEAGVVSKVAMDIKHRPEKYASAVGIPGFDLGPVRESAAWLLEEPVDYEFRTTVVKGLHEPGDLAAAAQWISGAKAYFLQQYKNSGEILREEGLSAYDEIEMRAFAAEAAPWVRHVELRGVEK